jgi:hypothetical protein
MKGGSGGAGSTRGCPRRGGEGRRGAVSKVLRGGGEGAFYNAVMQWPVVLHQGAGYFKGRRQGGH